MRRSSPHLQDLIDIIRKILTLDLGFEEHPVLLNICLLYVFSSFNFCACFM